MTATDQDTETDLRSPRPLAELLAHRRWVRRTEPFPHIVARNVFVPSFYRELHEEFGRIEREHPEVFQRNMPGYDASGAALGTYADGPLGVFVSREWHDVLTQVTGVRATGDVNASLHHHDPGGASGWPHNDLNPGWFGGSEPEPTEVRLNTDTDVHYMAGTGGEPGTARETVRAVSMLFYLGNPDWQPGDGGETGLYDSLTARVPSAVVPPVNNTLVIFECTPFSYHGFLRNHVKPRNSVVMWAHRSRADVEAMWGANSIVGW